jgi:Arc/MetJ-type ribon-helix-helix transcriptional regulator
MSQQIAVRLDDGQLSVLDYEVADGLAESRSDVIRRLIMRLERAQAYRKDAQVLKNLVARGENPYPDLVGLADFPFPALD